MGADSQVRCRQSSTKFFSSNAERLSERVATDRLSTAVNNTVHPAKITEHYEGLRRCYGLTAEKIQAGHGNENGDVEQRHHRFKRAVEHELLLRGSRDFGSLDAYVLGQKVGDVPYESIHGAPC